MQECFDECLLKNSSNEHAETIELLQILHEKANEGDGLSAKEFNKEAKRIGKEIENEVLSKVFSQAYKKSDAAKSP